MSSSEKVLFKSKKGNPVLMFFVGLAAGCILGFILLRLLFVEVLDMYTDVTYIIMIIGAGACGALVGYLMVSANHQTVIELEGDKFRMTKGKKVTEFPLSDFQGSHVTRNYYNGVYTGSTRSVKYLRNGKTVSLVVPLEDEDFTELISRIGLRRSGVEDLQDSEEGPLEFPGFEQFDLPVEAFEERNKKVFKRSIIVSVAVFVVALAICIAIPIISPQDSSFAVILGVLAVVLFLVLLIAAFIKNAKFKKNMRSTPAKITVDNTKLVMGDDTYYPDDITSIRMTPASYDSTGKDGEYRVLTIKKKSGENKKYYFGRTKKGDEKMMYDDYNKLLVAIFDWCAVKKIHFLQVLG